jgi:hypothetical protein
MSVLLLHMAYAEDVEDLVGLDGALPEAAEVGPVLPRMPVKAPRRSLRPVRLTKTPHQPLRRRAKPPRRWWPSRQPKTPQPWPGLRRWLNRC